MQTQSSTPKRFNSLSEAMRAAQLPAPSHPLITIINGLDNHIQAIPPRHSQMLNFYKISFRMDVGGKIPYGRTTFDFLEGGLFFAAPTQIIGADIQDTTVPVAPVYFKGQLILLLHPDFLAQYPLAKKIKQYNFFSYTVNEALLLSDKEKTLILNLFRQIEQELLHPIDAISQDIIIAQLDLLLNYAQRFYIRQFNTRKSLNYTIIEKINTVLEGYFDQPNHVQQGPPSVQYLAEHIHVSPGYLSDLLRIASGLNARQHIQEFLIAKAKEQLLSTDHSVNEIAYQLGFEHPQSFNKLFKAKTNQSPLQFRNSFN